LETTYLVLSSILVDLFTEKQSKCNWEDGNTVLTDVCYAAHVFRNTRTYCYV